MLTPPRILHWTALMGGLSLSAAKGKAASVDPPSSEVVIRLEVVADPSCATREALIRKIASRSTQVRFVESGPVELVRAEFRWSNGRVLGLLNVEQPTGERGFRSIRATSCEEAIDALALVAAVMLDAALLLKSRQPLDSVSPSRNAEVQESIDASAESGSNRATAAEHARPVAPDRPAFRRTQPAPRRARPSARNEPIRPELEPESMPGRSKDDPRDAGLAMASKGSLSASFGVAPLAYWGPAPKFLAGGAVYLGLKWQWSSLWAPSGRASLLHARRSILEPEHGSADFSVTGGMLELCPLAVGTTHLELRPCAMALGGVLVAKRSDTEGSQAQLRPWMTLGGSVLLLAFASELVEIFGNAGIGGALVQDRFLFGPYAFYRVPSMAFSTSIGIGLRFP